MIVFSYMIKGSHFPRWSGVVFDLPLFFILELTSAYLMGGFQNKSISKKIDITIFHCSDISMKEQI